MMETRTQLLQAATELFAERGFYGASVRDITGRVGASPTAIHYHFGSKEALYREIITQLASDQLAVAERVLSMPARSREELAVRLEVFFQQLLDCYLENRDTVRIMFREYELLLPHGSGDVVAKLFGTSEKIATFLRDAMAANLVRPEIDADIVAGMLLDRVLNQARFADAHQAHFNVSSLDETYRAYWVRATLDIVLNGICGTGMPSA